MIVFDGQIDPFQFGEGLQLREAEGLVHLREAHDEVHGHGGGGAPRGTG